MQEGIRSQLPDPAVSDQLRDQTEDRKNQVAYFGRKGLEQPDEQVYTGIDNNEPLHCLGEGRQA